MTSAKLNGGQGELFPEYIHRKYKEKQSRGKRKYFKEQLNPA